MDTHLDQPAKPGFGHQLHIRLAHARSDADQQPVAPAGGETFERPGQYLRSPATLIADDLRALDAQERRDVAQLRELAGNIVGDELTVREDLKVAVGVSGEQIEQLGMQKRFASENTEVGVPVRLRIADDPVEIIERQLLRGRGYIHPASLATKLTAGDDRDEEERGEVLAAPPPPFVELDRADPLHAEVVDELRHHLRLGLGQNAFGQGEQHVNPGRPERRHDF